MSEDKPVKFTQIEAEQLNIVDKDGKVRLSMFNQEHIPPAIMDGVDILPGHRQNEPLAGLMFYNSDGDECGGLIFGNEINEDGENTSFASLTFDQYKQDQVIQMMYVDNGGSQSYGFHILDRPNTNLGEVLKRTRDIEASDMTEEDKQAAINTEYEGNVQRAFMGKTKDGVSVRLMDSKGHERLRMVVDDNDQPRIEFLDEHGNVTFKLPPA